MTTSASARFALALFAGSVVPLSGAAADTLQLRPDRVAGGDSTIVTLTLDRAPQVDTDYPIALSGSNAALSEPTVRMRAGQTRVEFRVASAAAQDQQFVDIDVIDPSTRTTLARARLAVTPVVLTSLQLNKSAVVGGTPGSSVTGTVTLDGNAPPPGLTLALGQSCANCQQGPQQLSIPPSIRIPGGSRSATFTVESPGVAATKQFTVLASQGSVVKSAPLEVTTLRPQSIAVSPSTISGSQQTTVTVTLNAPAFNGFQVHLSCSQTLATDAPQRTCQSVPFNDGRAILLTVPAGQTSVSCHLSKGPSSQPAQVIVKAAAVGVNGEVQTTLTVAP